MKTPIIIQENETVLAIIIQNKNNLSESEEINFFTPNDYSQQLAYMHHKKGKIITPHIHKKIERNVYQTLEVLFITSGKIRVDFFTEKKIYLKSFVLEIGDVILLVSGGHGFEVIEDVEMFEVKQGPYIEGKDKERFSYEFSKTLFNK